MYIFQTWSEAFTASLQNLWYGFINFVPALLFAIIIFIVGWVVGSIVGRAVAQVISSLKVDKALKSAGVDEVVGRAGLTLNTGSFIGMIVKWFIIIVFLIASLDLLGLDSVNDFLRSDVLGYLPHVIVAALVLVIASVVADALDKVVRASAKASGVRSANFLGIVSRYAIWVVAIVVALTELGIAREVVFSLFQPLVYMFAIAGGLAFGLGGKDAAARWIARLGEHTKDM